MSLDKKGQIEKILREYTSFQDGAMKKIDQASTEIRAEDTKSVVRDMIATFEEIKTITSQKVKELKKIDGQSV